jgi:septal ring factor EnvC (AmiA/AmiB activator)
MWLLVLGALAFIIGVIALFIALDAKNGNTSDDDLTKSVRTEVQRSVPALKLALASQSKAIATAGVRLRRAERTAGARLRRAERTQRRLAGGQAIDRGDLKKLSAQIKGVQTNTANLTNEVNALKNQQNKTADSIAALNRRVNHLQAQQQKQKNGNGGV